MGFATGGRHERGQVRSITGRMAASGCDSIARGEYELLSRRRGIENHPAASR